jgi:hypothetical protein
MFKKRSKIMFTSAILGSLYLAYIVYYFLNEVGTTQGAEQMGAAIATTVVLPHIVLLALAVIMNWVGFFMNVKWGAISSGILYSVSGVIFLLYIFFVIPMIILSFVGVSKIGKIQSKLEKQNFPKEAH